MNKSTQLIGAVLLLFMISCKKESVNNSGPYLYLKYKFDSTQARLNNIGQASVIAQGNAGQSPVFNKMSAHYIELSPTAFSPLGSGAVIYHAPETTTGGANAIDFEKAHPMGNNEVFFSIPLKMIAPGDYEWLRLSLAYQNFDVKFYMDTVINGIQIQQEVPGTAAGFIGYRTYIKNLVIKNQVIPINANKTQGFWGFETNFLFNGVNYPFVSSGQAPPGATTVPNPLFATSPIPAGSCVVTAAFVNNGSNKLSITGNESADITIEVSLSTNKSFEWTDLIPDGRWEPAKGEQVVDMGIRGMIPQVLQ